MDGILTIVIIPYCINKDAKKMHAYGYVLVCMTTLAWKNFTLNGWKARLTRLLDFSHKASFSALNVAETN